MDKDSELAFDSWQQGSYKIFSRRCATVGKLDGLEPRSENTQYIMVPQDLTVFLSDGRKGSGGSKDLSDGFIPPGHPC
jgi:hypothetical protein